MARSRELVCNETQDPDLNLAWKVTAQSSEGQGEGYTFPWEGGKVLTCQTAGEGAGHQHARGRGTGSTFMRAVLRNELITLSAEGMGGR